MINKLVSALIVASMGIGTLTNGIPAVAYAAEGDTASVGTTYYFSSTKGDNSNNGTSQNTPWETLDN